jgi:hypothetical protein
MRNKYLDQIEKLSDEFIMVQMALLAEVRRKEKREVEITNSAGFRPNRNSERNNVK